MPMTDGRSVNHSDSSRHNRWSLHKPTCWYSREDRDRRTTGRSVRAGEERSSNDDQNTADALDNKWWLACSLIYLSHRLGFCPHRSTEWHISTEKETRFDWQINDQWNSRWTHRRTNSLIRPLWRRKDPQFHEVSDWNDAEIVDRWEMNLSAFWWQVKAMSELFEEHRGSVAAMLHERNRLELIPAMEYRRMTPEPICQDDPECCSDLFQLVDRSLWMTLGFGESLMRNKDTVVSGLLCCVLPSDGNNNSSGILCVPPSLKPSLEPANQRWYHTGWSGILLS